MNLDFSPVSDERTQCLKKLCKIVSVITSSNFHQFDNFWEKDGKEAKIMRGALTFHLT